jgi:hypothetical protein
MTPWHYIDLELQERPGAIAASRHSFHRRLPEMIMDEQNAVRDQHQHIGSCYHRVSFLQAERLGPEKVFIFASKPNRSESPDSENYFRWMFTAHSLL